MVSKKTEDSVFLTQYDRYLFNEGRNYKIYKKMGAHPAVVDGVECILPYGHRMPSGSALSVTVMAGTAMKII